MSIQQWFAHFWRRHFIDDDPRDDKIIGDAFVAEKLCGQCPFCHTTNFSYQRNRGKQRLVVRCNQCRHGYFVEYLNGVGMVTIEPPIG